jgi:hypothetical protein
LGEDRFTFLVEAISTYVDCECEVRDHAVAIDRAEVEAALRGEPLMIESAGGELKPVPWGAITDQARLVDEAWKAALLAD